MDRLRHRPPRLKTVFQVYDLPLYFLTLCVRDRKQVLSTPEIHAALRTYAKRGLAEKGAAVGRYVIMPDHIHLFVRIPAGLTLGRWVHGLKSILTRVSGNGAGFWQDGFFDHLVRNSESYGEKWA